MSAPEAAAPARLTPPSVAGSKAQYTCVQYPDLCDAAIIGSWWAPAQKQYLSDYNAKRGSNGGFFHQCFLGSYFEESFGTTPQAAGHVNRPVSGVWNQITVGGKTMQQAISEFWNTPMDSQAPGKFYQDDVWDPAGKPPSGLEGRAEGGAPVVPWWSARWMTNPTCRGFPWY